MSELESLILGIIQGLTEFLPVSSSGHIELGKALLNDPNAQALLANENLLFSVVVHAATALSTVVVYRNDIGAIILDLFKFKWNDNTRFTAKILLSMLPVMFVGLLFKDDLEALFTGNITLVGCMLIITGLLLSFTHYAKERYGKVTFPKALIIGVAQAIAVLPGISRSGATISTGIITGVERSKAARFSFLMVLIPIFGMTALELKDYLELSSSSTESHLSTSALIIGFIAAFTSGLLACNWMIKLVRRGKLIYFAYYCFIVGLVAISVSLINA